MRDAPDKYISDTIQITSTHTDISPETHNPNTFAYNEQKQPLSYEDISNNIQFFQEKTCHTYLFQPH